MQFVGSNRQNKCQRDYIKKKKKRKGSEMLINKVLKELERAIKSVQKKYSSKLEQVKSVSSIKKI